MITVDKTFPCINYKNEIFRLTDDCTVEVHTITRRLPYSNIDCRLEFVFKVCDYDVSLSSAENTETTKVVTIDPYEFDRLEYAVTIKSYTISIFIEYLKEDELIRIGLSV